MRPGCAGLQGCRPRIMCRVAASEGSGNGGGEGVYIQCRARRKSAPSTIDGRKRHSKRDGTAAAAAAVAPAAEEAAAEVAEVAEVAESLSGRAEARPALSTWRMW